MIEKRKNHFDVLPQGWVKIDHDSGVPIYLHRPSRSVTISRPYCLGTASARVIFCSVHWHSVSTAHTQISYFRNTSTLRDTQNHPFFEEFFWIFSIISLKKSKVDESFHQKLENLLVSQEIGRNDVRCNSC